MGEIYSPCRPSTRSVPARPRPKGGATTCGQRRVRTIFAGRRIKWAAGAR